MPAGADGSTTTSIKDEKEMIERAVRERINMPEPMAVPKAKDEPQILKVPPIPPDVRARYMADLHNRQRLSPSSLPSICMYTFLNSLHAVNSIRISHDGALVSAAMHDSTVRLYDLRDPSIRFSTNPYANTDEQGGFGMGTKDGLDATTDEGDLVDGLVGYGIIRGSTISNRRFGEENSRLPYSKLVGHSGPVYSTSLSPECQHLLSCSEDGTVRLWNLETKHNLVVYKGHQWPIWDVSFAPVGFYFATASHDGTARLWCTNHVSPLRLFVGHVGDVDVVRFHPNCNYLATASSDSTARLWDVQSGECVRCLVGHDGAVRSLCMDPEGRYMASGGEDGRVIVWDLGSGRMISDQKLHQQPVTALDYSADASIIASGSSDQSIKLIEAKKKRPSQGGTDVLRSFHTKSTPINFLSFTPRNLLLAAGVFNA